MLDPGSHEYDIKRTRLRADYDEHGEPDQHADRAANRDLEREHPPRPVGERAAGPPGRGSNSRGSPSLDAPERGQPSGGQLELRSTAFSDHTLMPERFSQQGANVSPPLEWGQVPDETRELVLLCEDPDVPGGGFTHWLVSGISPESTGTEEGALPERGIPGLSGSGQLAWQGPAPPVGDDPHQLVFRLYAVARSTGLTRGATAEEARTALDDHVVAHGTLVGLFAR